ncbi:hypothetical protein NEIFL0001_1775 [Neisseria flavescens SK114]|nr:hypothetical protein NEIFL0001_1775 [Neisseria flavescens SK114]
MGFQTAFYYLSCISAIFCFKPSFATIILIIILIIKCFQTA